MTLRTLFVMLALAPSFALAQGVPIRLLGSHGTGAVSNWGQVEFASPLTGQATRVGQAGLIWEADLGSNGKVYASTPDSIRILDPDTGLLSSPVVTFPVGTLIRSLAFSPEGDLYGTDNGGLNTMLYLISLEVGTLTPIGPVNDFCFGLEFLADGTLVGAGTGVFTINRATGARTQTLIPGAAGVLETWGGLDVDADGTVRAISNTLSGPDVLHTLSLGNGTFSPIGTINEETAWALVSIPAPASVGLWGAVLPMSRRRRR